MNGLPAYSMWWLIILWDWYFYTGDGAFLARQRTYALALIRQLAGLVEEDGRDRVPVYFFRLAHRRHSGRGSGSSRPAGHRAG